VERLAELVLREESGTLWTERYSGRQERLDAPERIVSVRRHREGWSIVTALSCHGFRRLWPGFASLDVTRTLSLRPDSPWVAMDLSLHWLGSATEIALCWTAAGAVESCEAETPCGWRRRGPYEPTPDTITGASFPALNWVRAGSTVVFNRGTPAHAVREQRLETILLRSPVRRWSPWFPVTPSHDSQDNGSRTFSFLLNLDAADRAFSDLHRMGMEFNVGPGAKAAPGDWWREAPANLVFAAARRLKDGSLRVVAFEADGRPAEWRGPDGTTRRLPPHGVAVWHILNPEP
jgi:hypothetical protein